MERFEKIIKLIAELIMPKYVFERIEMRNKIGGIILTWVSMRIWSLMWHVLGEV
jgi:hypothetical protein